MEELIILLPPLICIVMALWSRQIILSLGVGILVGAIIFQNSILSGFIYGADVIANVFSASWFVKNIIFLLLIGAIINVMEESGGVEGFINYVTIKNNYFNNGKKALFLSYLVGIGMFLDGIGSMMTAGMVGRPLIEKYNEPKEKLAFVCNSTGAPIAFLFPFGGAAAFIMGIVGSQIELGVISGNPFSYLISSLGFQYYTILMIIAVPAFIFFIKDYGPMAKINMIPMTENIKEKNDHKVTSIRMDLMILPIVLLITSILGIILLTGEGSILNGDATAGIYYGSLITVVFTGIYIILTKKASVNDYMLWVENGMKKMFPATLILILASAFGQLMADLQIASYLSDLILSHISPMWIPVGIFMTSFLIAFMTGSSGATIMIVLPIVIPLVVQYGILVPLAMGGTISGAVFGDQSSPVSDSVIVASMASGCSVIDHFKTQMPYTATIGVITGILYIGIGIIFV